MTSIQKAVGKYKFVKEITVGERTLVRECVLGYASVETDLFGWAKSEDFLPNPYDLIDMKSEDGLFYSGWWTGNFWDGWKIPPETNVVKWRRSEKEPTIFDNGEDLRNPTDIKKTSSILL